MLMKKILAIILALAMATVPAVAVLAAENGSSSVNGESGSSINVSGTYTPPGNPDTVISVDIAWDEMRFTYSQGSLGTWDPGTHDYINPGQGSWTTDTATIAITNHSNTDIRVDFSFTIDSAIESERLDIVGTFSKTTLVIDSADNDKYRAQAGSTAISAPSDSTEFGIRSNSEGIGEDKKLGTVSVAISQMVWQTISTQAELVAAIENAVQTESPYYVRLANDIAIVNDDMDRLNLPQSAVGILDLGGHTLTTCVLVNTISWAVIQNGTIKNTDSEVGRSLISDCNDLVIKNCVIEAVGEYSVEIYKKATLIDCTIKDGSLLCSNASEVVLVGTTLVPGTYGSGATKTMYICSGSTLTTDFDPTSMIAADLLAEGSDLTVADNGDGTWTASRP